MTRTAVACGTGAEPSGSNRPGGMRRVSHRTARQRATSAPLTPISQGKARLRFTSALLGPRSGGLVLRCLLGNRLGALPCLVE